MLSVFAKCRLINNQDLSFENSGLNHLDVRALENLFKTKPKSQITLKGFILERAIIVKDSPSQSLEDVLSNLSTGNLQNIIKEELVVNLLATYLRHECTIEDIATTVIQYMTILNINRINKSVPQSQKCNLTFVDANNEDILLGSLIEWTNIELEGMPYFDPSRIKPSYPKSKYNQLNKIIEINLYPMFGSFFEAARARI